MRARVFLLLIGISGCGGPVPPEMPNPPPPYLPVAQLAFREAGAVAEAAQVLVAVQARPESALEVLARHNLTESTWNAMMYKLAADPKDAAAFVAAVNREKEHQAEIASALKEDSAKEESPLPIEPGSGQANPQPLGVDPPSGKSARP